MYTQEQKKDHVRGLQKDLRLVHAQSGDTLPYITGKYDILTEQAVRQFQGKHNLPITGKTDLSTWDCIVHEANVVRSRTALPLAVRIFPHAAFTVREGDTGRFVYILQAMLNGLVDQFPRLLPIPYTGTYDQDTIAVIKALQHAMCIESSGELNAETWNMIADLHSNFVLRTKNLIN